MCTYISYVPVRARAPEGFLVCNLAISCVSVAKRRAIRSLDAFVHRISGPLSFVFPVTAAHAH